MVKMTPAHIHFVTSNAKKIAMLQTHGAAAMGLTIHQAELDIIEPQATSVTDVAICKAEQAYKLIQQPLIVEDSGFYIDGLDGFPGPYVKYALKTIGVQGLLDLAAGLEERVCRFVSVLVYVDQDGAVHTFVDDTKQGILAEQIDTTPCEEAWSDLWYVFIPDGASVPLSALNQAQKAALWRQWQTVSVYRDFLTYFGDVTAQYPAAGRS